MNKQVKEASSNAVESKNRVTNTTMSVENLTEGFHGCMLKAFDENYGAGMIECSDEMWGYEQGLDCIYNGCERDFMTTVGVDALNNFMNFMGWDEDNLDNIEQSLMDNLNSLIEDNIEGVTFRGGWTLLDFNLEISEIETVMEDFLSNLTENKLS